MVLFMGALLLPLGFMQTNDSTKRALKLLHQPSIQLLKCGKQAKHNLLARADNNPNALEITGQWLRPSREIG